MITLSSKDFKLELLVLNHYCHDALFEKDELVWDQNEGIVILPIKREMTESPKEKKRFPFISKNEFSLIGSIILFKSVLKMEVSIVDIEDNISNIDYQVKPQIITIHGVRGSIIKISVACMNIVLKDETDTEGNTSIWSFR